MNECVRIAITAGEPAGIGPDLCAALKSKPGVELIIIADPELLQSRGSTLGIDASFNQFNESNACEQISVLPLNTNASVATGTLDPANSAYVLESIRIAVDGCRDGLFDAMVTPPVHKGVINDAGIAFSGHTEFIAERLNATPLMVLAAEKLKVALVTTHLPLKEVANAITHDGIVNCLQILGESGHLGMEEINIITPAIETARAKGINATGPLPADTLFTHRHLEGADAVLAMFHDQGLPVLKYAGFGNSVNITFGLPIIRTSVDHGTALDLAGTGKATDGSLHAAIDLAIHLAHNNHRRN